MEFIWSLYGQKRWRRFLRRRVVRLLVWSGCFLSAFAVRGAAAESREVDEVIGSLDGRYWGLWGGERPCVYELRPNPAGGLQGTVTFLTGAGEPTADVTSVDVSLNDHGQWCVNWEPRPGDEGCADDLQLFSTSSGPCLAANFTAVDSETRKEWNLALLWIDEALPHHPQQALDEVVLEPVSTRAAQVEYFTAEDGLMSNNIRSLEQQGDTYLWVGATGGLSRYDGIHWERYSSANVPEFADHNITSILSTRSGAMVFTTKSRGVVVLRGGEFRAPEWNDQLFGQKVSSLAEGPDGALWFLNNDARAICRMDEEWRFEVFQMEDWGVLRLGREPGYGAPVNVLPLATGEVVIGSNAGLRRLDPVTGQASIISLETGGSSLYETRSGTIWARSNRHLRVLDTEAFRFAGRALWFRGVGDLIESRDGALWFTC